MSIKLNKGMGAGGPAIDSGCISKAMRCVMATIGVPVIPSIIGLATILSCVYGLGFLLSGSARGAPKTLAGDSVLMDPHQHHWAQCHGLPDCNCMA